MNVGDVDHPMAEDHWIEWVYVVTEEGVLARCLKPGDARDVSILRGFLFNRLF